MEEKRMPARYRMDETGQMRRTWNGKLPEEFNEKDMLLLFHFGLLLMIHF